MASIPGMDPFLFRLIKGKEILGVGCGLGKVSYFLRSNSFYARSKKCMLNKSTYIVGVDV